MISGLQKLVNAQTQTLVNQLERNPVNFIPVAAFRLFKSVGEDTYFFSQVVLFVWMTIR